MIILCLAANCLCRFRLLLVTSCKMYFPATVSIKFSVPIFALKSPNSIRMSYFGPFHILDLIGHKTHPLLCQGYPQLVHMLI